MTKDQLKKFIVELEEENKKLKSDLAFERTMLDNVKAEYDSLQNVNKKLNIKVSSLEWEIKWLNSVIDKLHEEIEEQEAEWGWLFDEIDYRKREAKRLWWKPNN